MDKSDKGQPLYADSAYTGEKQGKVILEDEENQRHLFSFLPGCNSCDWYFEQELNPKFFSFNTHWGACPRCLGLGVDDSQKICPECHGMRLKNFA